VPTFTRLEGQTDALVTPLDKGSRERPTTTALALRLDSCQKQKIVRPALENCWRIKEPLPPPAVLRTFLTLGFDTHRLT
jgi:hypothetical protein